LATLEFKQSAGRKGHLALYKGLVIGHTKNNGVQRVYCNPFPKKLFYGSHRLESLDLVMIWPTGINHGGFVVSPDTVWYAWFCSSFLSQPKPTRAPRRLIVLSCRRWKHTTIVRMVMIDFIAIMSILDIIVFKCDRSSLDPVLFPPDIFRLIFYFRLIFSGNYMT
jgi:hypothetical protein